MKNLTWQNPEQLFVAQELINKVKSKCCGIKVLKELSLISHAYVQSRLVVILLLELAIAIFCLHADLRQRIVVDAAGEDLLACILLRSAEARVVVFEVPEDVHLLTGSAQLLNL